jgi:hypothetical protein
MADSIENKLIDKRVAQRYVRKGLLDEKDWDKHVKTLPDLADQAVAVETSIGAEDVDGDEDDVDDVEDGKGGTAQP